MPLWAGWRHSRYGRAVANQPAFILRFMEDVMRKMARSGVACLLAFLLFSCVSTGETVESSWQDQTALDAGDGVMADTAEDLGLVASARGGGSSSRTGGTVAEDLYKGAGLAVAVLPPELDGGEPWMQQSFQDNITSLMARHTDMTVLDRKNEDLVIAQQELSETGWYSEENVVEIGQMTNAQYVVVGSIRRLSAAYECNFRVNETATNEIRAASTSRHSLADMESGLAVRQIVQELFSGLGIQLSEAERAALQKKSDVESTSITMLAKGAQAQAAEDYIQAVLYYNQVEGAFQQEAQTSTTQMLSASPENLTVRQRQQYNQLQREKWKKILADLRTYLDENLWIGVYDDPLIVEETDVSMNYVSYKVPSVMRIFPYRKAIIVAKRVLEEWHKVKHDKDNSVWIDGNIGFYACNWQFRIIVGLFDADGNQIGEASSVAWSSGLDTKLFSFTNPADYVVKSQKRYFDDAGHTEYLDRRWGEYHSGAVFDDVEISDMSENTVVPAARILKIEGTNAPAYSSEKSTCKLTLYSLAEWEALMAGR